MAYPSRHGTIMITVIILNFRTDQSGQIVKTLIRLLLEEQSDQGLHYLQYCLHLLHYSMVKPLCLNFRVITPNILGVQKFRTFTLNLHGAGVLKSIDGSLYSLIPIILRAVTRNWYLLSGFKLRKLMSTCVSGPVVSMISSQRLDTVGKT